MKTNLFLVMLLSMALVSCQAVGDIFKAGFNVGIFLAIAIVVLILYFLLRKK